jgi:hypothetical protein
MIIKSHIRGGYRAAATYLKDIGENEKTRLVQITDPDAKNLDEAFHNMWTVASTSRAKKPLHHVSINPFKDERLTDEQVRKIVKRCEEKYGYKPDDHQRMIVEHIKDGRQHFHVMWNRVSLATGKAVWPGEHWKKSKQVAREMEKELGLKRPEPRRVKRLQDVAFTKRPHEYLGRYQTLTPSLLLGIPLPNMAYSFSSPKMEQPAPFSPITPASNKKKWPEAAIIDWEVWGHENPVRFFSIWPELKPDGFELLPLVP